MSRVDELKTSLAKAPQEILNLLADGPKKAAELYEGLGYSCFDVWITNAIGDRRGQWDDSPHQLALSDLVETGQVQWRYNDKLDVEYALAGTWPQSECGNDSPMRLRIERFLDTVVNLVGSPRYTQDGSAVEPEPQLAWAAPCLGVRELDDNTRQETRSLFSDGAEVQIIDYDFVVGTGADEPDAVFKWPDCEATPNLVAETLLKALKESHDA